ncbi:MAG: hypothetical protein M3160_01605 [Candidatus Eremiobacteraeota bacterium]|nr:hypothetical protein [Candidatus Eremiobacteraeota bacterium]
MKRFFFSTGEASGELVATMLAAEIARLAPASTFCGIGGERMLKAGFRLRWNTRGWSSIGPVAALSRIPKLGAILLATAWELWRDAPDLIVLVDFGAFNLRLARLLRRFGYTGPVLYFFPPGAWLDNAYQARAVARTTIPLTPFAHQFDFYRSRGLGAQYFGHPLLSAYTMRPAPSAPASDGGIVAVFPGSRRAELRFHFPVLLEAMHRLRETRGRARFIIAAADADAGRFIDRMLAHSNPPPLTVVNSAQEALATADAAWIASGTAVLEAALCGVPAISLYILPRATARVARNVYRRPYVTIPNLVLHRAVIPEFLQEAATAENLRAAMDTVLKDPRAQFSQVQELRAALGPADALSKCAAFARSLAE